jgi:hypothetical protein
MIIIIEFIVVWERIIVKKKLEVIMDIERSKEMNFLIGLNGMVKNEENKETNFLIKLNGVNKKEKENNMGFLIRLKKHFLFFSSSLIK